MYRYYSTSDNYRTTVHQTTTNISIRGFSNTNATWYAPDRSKVLTINTEQNRTLSQNSTSLKDCAIPSYNQK